ncbi:MAG: hypothetical protein MET45_20835 [Nostoc sp. LLA-1]|nr:hypothetical protein [Cyanocohniella sp. LLY]
MCSTIRDIAIAENIPKTPVVGIELCDDNPNAYAVGTTRSLVFNGSCNYRFN